MRAARWSRRWNLGPKRWSRAARLIILGVSLALFCLPVVGTGVALAADPWTVTQLTNNRFDDSGPSVDAGRVAWTRNQREVWEYGAERYNDILLRDLSTDGTNNVSNSADRGDYGAVLSGNLLVWQAYDEPHAWLFAHDLTGGSTTTLATSDIDRVPGVSDGRYVAWAGWPANAAEGGGYDRESISWLSTL